MRTRTAMDKIWAQSTFHNTEHALTCGLKLSLKHRWIIHSWGSSALADISSLRYLATPRTHFSYQNILG